jgi:hypothetical protein
LLSSNFFMLAGKTGPPWLGDLSSRNNEDWKGGLGCSLYSEPGVGTKLHYGHYHHSCHIPGYMHISAEYARISDTGSISMDFECTGIWWQFQTQPWWW